MFILWQTSQKNETFKMRRSAYSGVAINKRVIRILILFSLCLGGIRAEAFSKETMPIKMCNKTLRIYSKLIQELHLELYLLKEKNQVRSKLLWIDKFKTVGSK